jgi:hypothetical protein
MNSISLFDKKYTGGLDSAGGYHFEDSYILSQLPSWLQLTDLKGFQQELLTDLELFFESGKRWFIQIKDHRVTLTEFREIVNDFHTREVASSGQYEKYTIVSPGLSRSIDQLKRRLERFRTAQNYTETELAVSRTEIASELEKLKCGDLAEFVMDKLHFHSNIGWVKDEEVVRDRFTGSLLRRYEISPKSADDLYLRTTRLLVAERGKLIKISLFQEALKQRQLEDQAYQLSYFDLVTAEFLDRYRDSNEPSFFYQGTVPTWADIVHNRDIPRDIMDEILSRVDHWGEGKLLVPILAEGGEGKSTLLRRMAVEFSKRNRAVLYHRRHMPMADIREIEWVAEMANQCAYVFIDDAPRVQNFTAFIRSLADLSFPIVLIVASRPYEWESLRSVYSANIQLVLAGDNHEYSLKGLTDHEIEQLLRRLSDAGLIDPLSEEEVQFAVEFYGKRSKRKLLVLVLELTHGERVEEIIRDEIERVRRMGSNIFAAYRYICLMGSVNSFMTTSMLSESVDADNVELDIVGRLPGLVEAIGEKVYVRHDKIGEITTNIIFDKADDQRGDLLCKLITFAFRERQLGVVNSMTDFIHRSIPKSQLFKIIAHIVDEAYCSGEFVIIHDVIESLMTSFEHHEVLEELLIAKTPLIWDSLVFPLPSKITRLDWDKLKGLPFSWPPCADPTEKQPSASSSLEIGLKWADIFAGSVRWGQYGSKYRETLTLIAELMYMSLAISYPEDTAMISFEHAEFLRGICRDEDAISLYGNVVESNPGHSEAHVGLAASLYFIGDYQGALYHFRAAQELDCKLLHRTGEDYTFEEMLERLGEWEELIKLKKAMAQWHFDTMRKIQRSEIWKGMAIESKLHKNRDEQDRIGADDVSEEAVQTYIASLDKLLEFSRTLPEAQRVELGRVYFASWFGELRQKPSSDEVSSTRKEDQN